MDELRRYSNNNSMHGMQWPISGGKHLSEKLGLILELREVNGEQMMGSWVDVGEPVLHGMLVFELADFVF